MTQILETENSLNGNGHLDADSIEDSLIFMKRFLLAELERAEAQKTITLEGNERLIEIYYRFSIRVLYAKRILIPEQFLLLVKPGSNPGELVSNQDGKGSNNNGIDKFRNGSGL